MRGTGVEHLVEGAEIHDRQVAVYLADRSPELSKNPLQLTAKHKVATPANWKRGDDVILAGSLSDEEAKKIYPEGWKAPKPYLRIVPQPQA